MKKTHFELEIEKYVPPGIGLGYWEGKPIFVPETLKGDRVLIALDKNSKAYCKAQLQEVIRPAPDRKEAPCPHYAQCGGCDAMHMDYEIQISWKQKILEETLEQQGVKFEAEIEFVATSNLEHYRHRTRLHYDGKNLGFKVRKSEALLEIPECKVLSKALKKNILLLKNQLKANLSRHNPSCELLLQSATQKDDIAVTLKDSKHLRQLRGWNQKIEEDYGWGIVELNSAGFAQSNPIMMTLLIQAVLDACKDSDFVGELYCGLGSFSLPLSSQVQKIWAYDIEEEAILQANKNAQHLGINNCIFQAAPANKVSFPQKIDTLLVDPPRKGLSKSVLKRIKKMPWKRLIYVSCNPASFARDLSELTRDSSIQIQKITAYDFYAHTTHLEVLGILEK